MLNRYVFLEDLLSTATADEFARRNAAALEKLEALHAIFNIRCKRASDTIVARKTIMEKLHSIRKHDAFYHELKFKFDNKQPLSKTEYAYIAMVTDHVMTLDVSALESLVNEDSPLYTHTVRHNLIAITPIVKLWDMQTQEARQKQGVEVLAALTAFTEHMSIISGDAHFFHCGYFLNLSGADLTDVDLHDARLSFLNLEFAEINNASLFNTTFVHCCLDHVKIVGYGKNQLMQTVFVGCSLYKSVIESVYPYKFDAHHSTLIDTDFDRVFPSTINSYQSTIKIRPNPRLTINVNALDMSYVEVIKQGLVDFQQVDLTFANIFAFDVLMNPERLQEEIGVLCFNVVTDDYDIFAEKLAANIVYQVNQLALSDAEKLKLLTEIADIPFFSPEEEPRRLAAHVMRMFTATTTLETAVTKIFAAECAYLQNRIDAIAEDRLGYFA